MTTIKRRFKPFIQPVPRGNWGDNLATLLPKEIWDGLRKAVHKKNNHMCQLCGTSIRTLNCHEDWFYDDKKHIQTLYRLMTVCIECHNTIHWFRTEGEIKHSRLPASYITDLRNHFMKVNECTEAQLNSHLRQAEWKIGIRNIRPYKLDYAKYSIERISTAYYKAQGKT